MKFQIKKMFSVGLMIALSFVLAQCAAAPDGFNASSGAHVIMPDDLSFATDEDTLVPATIQVTQPITRTSSQDLTQTTIDGPGNDIFVILQCNNCTIFDRAAGESATLPVASRLQAVSNPYTVKTNSRGLYSVVLGIQAPANVGAATSYIALLGADIGVEAQTMTINVSTP